MSSDRLRRNIYKGMAGENMERYDIVKTKLTITFDIQTINIGSTCNISTAYN